MKYIYNEFEKNDFWAALTEFMRFEADAMHQINQDVNPNDVQAQTKMNRLYGDLEQLKLLVKIKL